MNTSLTLLTERLTDFGLKLIVAAAVLVVGLKIAKKISSLILNIKSLEETNVSVIHFLSSAVKIILYMLVIFSSAIIIGVPSATLVTVLGSIGLAVGLALQGSLSNLAGSVMILVFKPFRIGDYIEAGSVAGTVKDINLFYTVITTFDGKTVTCPNGKLSNGDIINYTSSGTRRVDLTFTVSYDSDIDKVKDILMACAEAEGSVLSDPAPEAFLKEHGPDGLVFSLRAWCKSDDFVGVKNSLTENVKKAFDNLNIEIPYRQLDIHLRK